MIEKKKDELIELMGEEASEGEIESVDKVREYIVDRNTKKILMFPIRDEIIDIVYKDCQRLKKTKNRECFQKKYNELYKTAKIPNEELTKTAFGKSYAKTFNYDYDASLISSYIFCKTINVPGAGEWHIDSINDYEYKIRKGNGFYFRGDTMTSWSTILYEFIRQYGDEFFDNLEKNKSGKWIYGGEGEGACKSWEEFLSITSNHKMQKPLPKYIMNFMDVVYKIGNLCPVPIGFNRARSNFGDYDYWDLTLMKIREWYISIDSKSLYERDKLISEDLLHNGGDSLACLRWLESFGQGQMGWHNFVDTLYMQDYVDNDYEVIPFWDGHEWDKENGTVKVKFPTDKDEKIKSEKIKEAFKTMADMIRARSERIAKALVGVVDEKNKI